MNNKPLRELTVNDLNFLNELQHELRTQDTMYTAEPVYWGICYEEYYPTADEYADDIILVDSNEGTALARGVNDIRNYISENYKELYEIYCKQDNIDLNKTNTYELQEFTLWMKNETTQMSVENKELFDNIELLSLIPVSKITKIMPDLFFLTHKDAVDHLTKYSYNYNKSARPYCMHAERSGSYEKLLNLLQEIDWNKINIQK